MTNAEAPRDQRPEQEQPVQPVKPSGGVARIVIGIVLIVLVVLGAVGNAASGQLAPSGGGPAEALGTLLGRLIFIALGVALLVSGLRARRRAR
jgi:Mn2+/Fe2+ NRAMP family transporter